MGMISADVMLQTCINRASQPLRHLLSPIGVRGRVKLATGLILTPLFILVLVSANHEYRLARALQADGHATAVRDTIREIAATIALAVALIIGTISLSARVVEMRVLRPMRHLTLAASRLSEGELDARVDMKRIKMSDMRTLGETLNAMARILEKLALTDSLTAVANRRHFDQVVSGEVRRAGRMKKGLALLLVDVDKFKDYNDLYGHGGGDLCLKRIAQALQDTVRRPADLVARYGGEEFAILLPDTDEDGALTIARQLLAAIRALGIPHHACERGIVTISIGIAVATPPPVIDPVLLVERADQALYAAKQAGRDRVLVNESMTRAA
jgi:diguanylate cyclase (GGDEF)-like protein